MNYAEQSPEQANASFDAGRARARRERADKPDDAGFPSLTVEPGDSEEMFPSLRDPMKAWRS